MELRDLREKHLWVTNGDLERCLSQMLLAGYSPGNHCRECFRDLALDASGIAKDEAARTRNAEAAAVDHLWSYAERNYTRVVVTPETSEIHPTPVEADILGAAPHVFHLEAPTEIRYDGDAVTALRQVWVRNQLDDLGPNLNPMEWSKLSPFFEVVRAEGRPRMPRATEPWSGLFFEHFVINWNRVRFNSFKTHLTVDFTWDAGLYRTDYSLAYEEDDQLLLDNGFVEARKIPGHPGWTQYRMSKTVKFASAFLNFLVPAALCMWVESDSEGLVASRSLLRRMQRCQRKMLAYVRAREARSRARQRRADRREAAGASARGRSRRRKGGR